MDRSFVPSIVPNSHDQNFYLVINNYGNFGPAFAETDVSEADLETSEDVSREILRRLDLAGDALPSSIAAFVDRHLGPDRQLTLRLT
jgi:hypothetical protein